GALARVDFYMVEPQPVEAKRVRALQYGLTLDMLPHLFALLTYFGPVNTIDEIQVIEAGQYDPLVSEDPVTHARQDISAVFRNETFSEVRFTFEDYSRNG